MLRWIVLLALVIPALCVADEDTALPAHYTQHTETLATGHRPETDEEFVALKEKGIEVLVNVDGSAPDVEAARRHGMRYLHIPVPYESFSDETLMQVKRLVDDAPGKLYVHCHHGVHRAPAFAAVMLRMQGNAAPDDARKILEAAGTSPGYPGLWHTAAEQAVEGIAPCAAPLPERAEVSDVVQAMVRVDNAFDLLKLWMAEGRKPLPNHPDFVPANAAQECIEGMQPMRHMPPEEAEYDRLLDASIAAARKFKSTVEQDGADVERAFKTFQQSCADCHKVYRNPGR